MCGRENSIGNVMCSNCGTSLTISTKEQAPNYPVDEIKKEDIEKVFKDLNIEFKKRKQRLNLELLRPNETKLFLFVNLVFTSLFLHLFVKYQIIFVIIFYPILYWFACYWSTKDKFDWQNFVFQFASLIILFSMIFYVIPVFL